MQPPAARRPDIPAHLRAAPSQRLPCVWMRLQACKRRAARLAKSNPYSVEGLLQSKNKFAKQYSTTPGFKSKLENCCTLMSARSISQRPPGARFFLQQRRKNRGRKTPLRAGGGRPQASGPSICFANAFLIERERGSKTAPFTLSLPGARSNCVRHRSRTLYQLPGRFVTASVVRPGKLAACRLPLRLRLRRSVLAC